MTIVKKQEWKFSNLTQDFYFILFPFHFLLFNGLKKGGYFIFFNSGKGHKILDFNKLNITFIESAFLNKKAHNICLV